MAETTGILRPRRSAANAAEGVTSDVASVSTGAGLAPGETRRGPRVSPSLLVFRFAIVCALFYVAYRITVTPFSSNNVRVTCTSDQELYRVRKHALSEDRFAAVRECLNEEGSFSAILRRDHLTRIAHDSTKSDEDVLDFAAALLLPGVPSRVDPDASKRVARCVRCALDAFNLLDTRASMRLAAANMFRVRHLHAVNDSATRAGSFVLNAIDEASVGSHNSRAASDQLVYVSHETSLLLLNLPVKHANATPPSVNESSRGCLLLLRGLRSDGGSPASPPNTSLEPVQLSLEENMIVSWRGDTWYQMMNVSERASWISLEQYIIDPKELARFHSLSHVYVETS